MGGELFYSEIQKVFDKYPEYKELIKIFVETGTYKGHTSRMASKHFEMVYTFEIVEALYYESIMHGLEEGIKNIKYHLGDSVELLKTVIPLINRPTVFFIDAHISGSDTFYNNKDFVPLLGELNEITNVNKGSNIFIIDDARFWNTKNKPYDWKDITVENILKVFENDNVKVKESWFDNDRFFIVT